LSAEADCRSSSSKTSLRSTKTSLRSGKACAPHTTLWSSNTETRSGRLAESRSLSLSERSVRLSETTDRGYWLRECSASTECDAAGSSSELRVSWSSETLSTAHHLWRETLSTAHHLWRAKRRRLLCTETTTNRKTGCRCSWSCAEYWCLEGILSTTESATAAKTKCHLKEKYETQDLITRQQGDGIIYRARLGGVGGQRAAAAAAAMGAAARCDATPATQVHF
jgi:hypothetical protein